MSSQNEHPMDTDPEEQHEEEVAMLGPDEADEEMPQDEDARMDEDEAEAEAEEETLQEIHLQNDSVAHFDIHKDSLFCIAQHPTQPNIVATGGGDDVAYIWDATPPDGPILPRSYESNPQPVERKGQEALAKLDGHEDSVNAITFTSPKGEYVVTAGLDGQLRAYSTASPFALVGAAKEVEEINWLLPCPHPQYPNTVAFGANDGSVWVYVINASDTAPPLTIVQSFFMHTASCTAGAWTPDGKLLATVSEDSSLYVWDVFDEAAAAGLVDASSPRAVVGLTASDERFKVDGGLYSVAISPGGAIAAVGGAGGHVRVIGLPRLSLPAAAAASTTTGLKGAGARSKAGGGKQSGTPASSAGQAGTILASVQAQTDGVETLNFSQAPLTLLAAGSVDGSVVLFDAAHNFAMRRNIPEAHEEEAVIKVEFVKSTDRPWILTTCGNDGVIRRWDARGGTAAAANGLVGEWKGHRGGGEGGGILGFVQGGDGRSVITAGDDGVALVFDTQ